MKTRTIKIELLSWWHASSGLGRGGDADALVIRDARGLPYLPGKTLKGLLRDAVQLEEDYQQAKGRTERLFGPRDPTTLDPSGSQREDEPPGRTSGVLRVGNAVLSADLAKWLCDGGEVRKAALFSTLSSTALDENGVAQPHTLRSVEVAPPLALFANVSGPDDSDDWIQTLERCLRLVRALGSHRHRGLGLCRLSLEPENPAHEIDAPAPEPGIAADGNELWLKIELISDLVVSRSAASSGGHESLDYLPGSVLLGAAAAGLFKHQEFGPDVFLSGKVRFHDGLLLDPDGFPCWPMPLNYQCVKLQGVEGEPINGLIDTQQDAAERTRNKQQTQQIRSGHLTSKGVWRKVQTGYVLKTALDRNAFGRARDRQLFEYETLTAGARFLAAISFDKTDPGLVQKVRRIAQVLTRPDIALGRSRSAEFGRVRISISKAPASLPASLDDGVAPRGAPAHPLHFYLVSDLALGAPGAPRLIPQATDFGLPDKWQLRLERTFLRTRSYSPWNSFHHTRLTERQVLTRGSVVTFARGDGIPASPAELAELRRVLSEGVGEYRHDGLGRVLLNPEFVLKPPRLAKPPEGPANPPEMPAQVPRDDPLPASAPRLAEWVMARQNDREVRRAALACGIDLGKDWWNLHCKAAELERVGRSGKSQWNEVRQFALRARGDLARLEESLKHFCTSALRKRLWCCQVGDRSLWTELKRALQADADFLNRAGQGADRLPRGPLVCSAIAAAAETIVRRLQEENQPEPTGGD